MANISSLITIENFVKSMLFKERKDEDDFMLYMQVSLDGIRDMHIHDFGIVATKVVTVDSTTKTFSYPTDYVSYVRIATPYNGRWWSYTRDDGLVPLKDDDATTIQSSMPNVAENVKDTSYSSGGANMYYFKPDDKNRRFIVSGFSPDIVVLQYVTNGIDADGDVSIPAHARTCLELWVKWQMAINDKEAVSRTEMLRTYYEDARRDMRKAEMPSLEDIKDVVYRSSGQGPRR